MLNFIINTFLVFQIPFCITPPPPPEIIQIKVNIMPLISTPVFFMACMDDFVGKAFDILLQNCLSPNSISIGCKIIRKKWDNQSFKQ